MRRPAGCRKGRLRSRRCRDQPVRCRRAPRSGRRHGSERCRSRTRHRETRPAAATRRGTGRRRRPHPVGRGRSETSLPPPPRRKAPSGRRAAAPKRPIETDETFRPSLRIPPSLRRTQDVPLDSTASLVKNYTPSGLLMLVKTLHRTVLNRRLTPAAAAPGPIAIGLPNRTEKLPLRFGEFLLTSRLDEDALGAVYRGLALGGEEQEF